MRLLFKKYAKLSYFLSKFLFLKKHCSGSRGIFGRAHGALVKLRFHSSFTLYQFVYGSGQLQWQFRSAYFFDSEV